MSRVEEFVGRRVIKIADCDGNGDHLYSQWLTREPIVRCRDCIGSVDDGISFRCETFIANGEDPDGFCAWGERRETS